MNPEAHENCIGNLIPQCLGSPSPDLEDEFAAAPPDAVFVAQYYIADVTAGAPRIRAMLAEDYAVAAQVPSGTWYRR